MTSILDRLENDRSAYHVCGGTILTGGVGEQRHIYCDTCGAFSYDPEAIEANRLPDGIDQAANLAASDDGEEESPWA